MGLNIVNYDASYYDSTETSAQKMTDDLSELLGPYVTVTKENKDTCLYLGGLDASARICIHYYSGYPIYTYVDYYDGSSFKRSSLTTVESIESAIQIIFNDKLIIFGSPNSNRYAYVFKSEDRITKKKLYFFNTGSGIMNGIKVPSYIAYNNTELHDNYGALILPHGIELCASPVVIYSDNAINCCSGVIDNLYFTYKFGAYYPMGALGVRFTIDGHKFFSFGNYMAYLMN